MNLQIGMSDRDLNDQSSRSIYISNEIDGASGIRDRYPLNGGRLYGIF